VVGCIAITRLVRRVTHVDDAKDVA